MTKKRLIVDIDEAVHSRLKSEAAQIGIALGPYCASLLEISSQIEPPVSADTSNVSTMTLDSLRRLATDLGKSQPRGWEQSLRNINTEIRRRYRI